MIVRIVKMFVETKNKDVFTKQMTGYQPKIKKMDGCMHHDIFCDKKNQDIFYSYTIWDSVESLNKYRDSELIKEILAFVQPLCTKEPQAWTVDKVFEK